MKYIKTYEEINQGTPEVGDFVLCDISRNTVTNDELYQAYTTTIGKIVTMDDNNYEVYFDSIDDFDYFHNSEIIYWSKNKSELEYVLNAKKYNL